MRPANDTKLSKTTTLLDYDCIAEMPAAVVIPLVSDSLDINRYTHKMIDDRLLYNWKVYLSQNIPSASVSRKTEFYQNQSKLNPKSIIVT